MRHREKGRRLPDIDVLARAFLRRGLSQHPDAAPHVANTDDIENMSVWELLNLAKTIGVDPAAMIRSLEQEDDKRWEYTHRHPGFEGELEFDLVFELAGKRVTRKAKVVYTHTPEWEYFDKHKQAPNTGWPSSSWHTELETALGATLGSSTSRRLRITSQPGTGALPPSPRAAYRRCLPTRLAR